jgi:acetyl esterase
MTDDRVLAEGLSEYLAAVRRPSGAVLSLETARLLADRDAHRIAYPRPAGMRVSNSHVVGAAIETPVRIYRPTGEWRRPAIVYFHGGGFTIGSVESYDCLATALAEATGATVVSVHYVRLPESTPRAMLEQCYDVLCWTTRMAEALGIDTRQMAVAGDSAGAFIAAHLAALARDRGGPALICQLLCYGVYDMDPSRAAHAPARDPVLTRPVIEAMIRTYRECDARGDPPVPAPLALGDLSDLPPAVMLGGEHDAVLAEGHDYAVRLRDAGVAVVERIAPGLCHGFLRAVRFSASARDEMQWLGAAFRTFL